MSKYFELITDFKPKEMKEIKGQLESGSLHPRDAKMLLAKTIVRMYHGANTAEKAEQHFISVFQQGAMPEDIPTITWDGESKVPLIDLLVKLQLLSSKSEARRMIENRGVKLNNIKAEDTKLEVTVSAGLIVQVGKRKFVKIITGE